MAREKILIVDGHSVVFQSPGGREAYARAGASVREALVRSLASLQDSSDWSVAVVFDGRGPKVSAGSSAGVKIFYSRAGQPADAIIERLAAKYASSHDVTVATDDRLERLTVEALGAVSISTARLLAEIDAARTELRDRIDSLRRTR